MEPTEPADQTRLSQLVHDHEVCWDVQPLDSVARGQGRLQVGFELVLSGVTPPDTDEAPLPGDEAVDRVFAALREIARDIMPASDEDAAYTIEPFEHGVQESPRREHRDEVRLKIAITHRTGYHRPVDESEVESLHAMERQLAELGACKGRWTPPDER